jgi:hypothetical protein
MFLSEHGVIFRRYHHDHLWAWACGKIFDLPSPLGTKWPNLYDAPSPFWHIMTAYTADPIQNILRRFMEPVILCNIASLPTSIKLRSLNSVIDEQTHETRCWEFQSIALRLDPVTARLRRCFTPVKTREFAIHSVKISMQNHYTVEFHHQSYAMCEKNNPKNWCRTLSTLDGGGGT